MSANCTTLILELPGGMAEIECEIAETVPHETHAVTFGSTTLTWKG